MDSHVRIGEHDNFLLTIPILAIGSLPQQKPPSHIPSTPYIYNKNKHLLQYGGINNNQFMPGTDIEPTHYSYWKSLICV